LKEFLAGESAARQNYHLVTAADVFVYVSDLAPVVAAIAQVLVPDGVLAFTVETHAGDGVKLLPTLRFAHGEASLRATIAAAGLTLCYFREASIRTESGAPVPGHAVVATSPRL
jgi:predicted TPR repeat methyltransferase